jgi:predicted nucleic acid-binding protein
MAERTVAADATVLIFLGKLRRLEWLHDQYDSVLIPETVYEEVVEQGKAVGAADATVVAQAIDAGWIRVEAVEPREDIRAYDLEAGETAVLSVAVDHGHDEVLADEESVREVARHYDLEPRGTLWFLFTAVETGEITFDEFVDALERLLDKGFYLDEGIYLRAVRKARQLADE